MRRILAVGWCTALTVAACLASLPAIARADSVTFGTPMQVAGIGQLNAIACGSASSCLAVGEGATVADSGTFDYQGVVVPIVNGVPGSPETIPPPNGAQPGYLMTVSAVSCPTASTCVVVGNFTNGDDATVADQGAMVVVVVDGVPQQAQLTAGSGGSQLAFSGVDCPTGASCVAVGSQSTNVCSGSSCQQTPIGASAVISGAGVAVSLDPAVYEFSNVECDTSQQCLASAVDSNLDSEIVSFTGDTYAAPRALPKIGSSAQLACSSVSYCLALTGDDGGFQPIVAGVPGTASQARAGLVGSCPATSLCWTVGDYDVAGRAAVAAVTPIVDGVAGSEVDDSAIGPLAGVACSSPTSCLAIETPTGIVSFTGDASGSSGSGSPGTGSSGAGRASVGRVTSHGTAIRVPLSCGSRACSVRILETLTTTVRRDGRRSRVTTVLAERTVRLSAGRRTTASLSLDAAGRRAIARASHHRLTVTVVVDAAGHATRRTVTLSP